MAECNDDDDEDDDDVLEILNVLVHVYVQKAVPPEPVSVIHFILDRNPDPLDHWRGIAKVVGEKQVLGCGGWG